MQFSSIQSTFVIVIFFILSFCDGNNICDFEPCLDTYNNLKGLYDTYRHQDATSLSFGVKNSICSQQNELKDCTKKQSKNCRGDLNYHFFVRLVQRIQSANPIGHNCTGFPTVSDSNHKSTPSTMSSSGRGLNTQRHSSRNNYNNNKCLPKLSQTEPSVGCALFGLTNLKSFSDPLNFTEVPYCSLSGAWSMIDTPELAIQITNNGGLSPMPKDITTTTLVTVLIKNNECTERKTYQATFDEVPGMFNDGSSTAGSVYIEEITKSEHVRLHFAFISTTIDVIKVTGHLPIPTLSVTIKMPQVNAHALSNDLTRSAKGLPLCFYGCPKTANIKPRSVDPSHRCPGSSDDQADPSTEFLNTANSITSAICDSLSNVQNILKESSTLDSRPKLSGEENSIAQSDSTSSSESFHHQNSYHPRFSPVAENSALTSQSVGSLYYSCRSLFLLFTTLLLYSCR